MDIDIKKLRCLSRLMLEGGLTRLELAEGECRILLEKASPPYAAYPAAVEDVSGVCPDVGPAGLPDRSPDDPPGAGACTNVLGASEVRSPIVGVLYLSPTPGAEPFVREGSRVKAGDVLCIVEAMKLMNEITAEREGEVLEVCAANGEVVEYGRLLFRIK